MKFNYIRTCLEWRRSIKYVNMMALCGSLYVIGLNEIATFKFFSLYLNYLFPFSKSILYQILVLPFLCKRYILSYAHFNFRFEMSSPLRPVNESARFISGLPSYV